MQRREFFKIGAGAALAPPANAAREPFRIGFLGSKQREQYYRLSAATPTPLTWTAVSHAQAVIVASPLERRGKDALAELRAGRHVLIEPPVAISFEDFDPLLGESNARNLRIGAAYPLRYAPHCIRAREVLQSGLAGGVGSIQAEASSAGEADSGFLGWATHLVDLARWILGSALVSVAARPDLQAKPDVPSGALHLSVSFQSGRATYDASSGAASSGDWTLTAAAPRASLRLTGAGRLLEMPRGGDWAEQPVPSAADAVSLLVADFVEACSTGREPGASAADGMAGVVLLSGAVASARGGRAIELLHNHYQYELDAAYERATGKRN